jgi:dipeptidase
MISNDGRVLNGICDGRMFHIAADDTGASAIWAAQRVPDEHITAVANQFTIGELHLDDPTNYLGIYFNTIIQHQNICTHICFIMSILASANVKEVAIRNGIWSPSSDKPFHFTKAYSTDRKGESFAATRRVWRVLTLAAPSLLPIFSPYTDSYSTFGYGVDGSSLCYIYHGVLT